MVDHTDLDQVWMVVSPQNPLKLKESLAKDYDRLHLVQLAIGENTQVKASDVEFSLPKPSYTVETLIYLKEKFPDKDFVLIMGGDNLATIQKWKNYQFILDHYFIYLYKRPKTKEGAYFNHPKVRTFEAPLLDISASYIREVIQQGKSIRYLVPDAVYEYLLNSSLYKKRTTNKN